MVEHNLYASREFFKEISVEAQRIKIVFHYIQPFVDQAKVRGARVGDKKLLAILDHIEVFLTVIQESSDHLETICARI